MLEVAGLTKSFATADGVAQAVKGIDFTVEDGDFYTLLGPSGCGKTTTLRCIAGLERPDGGVIRIGGTVVDDPANGVHVPAHRRNIGMVFQSYAIWPHLDVFDNVAYPLRVNKPRPPKAEIADRVGEALRQVGMEDYAGRSATKLSGGQQQRVALARALVREPKLLLLDEPLSNLDAKLREQMRVELEEMVGRIAITSLYVTHDQSEALSMSDRIAVMGEGLIVQEGAPREVYGHPATEFVAAFLGTANFVPGTVEGLANGVARMSLAGGAGALELPAAGLAEGDEVELMVRPEDMRLSAERPADGTGRIAGRLKRVDFQGGHSECFVEAADMILRCTTHGAMATARGTEVWIEVDPAHCVVFGAGRGR